MEKSKKKRGISLSHQLPRDQSPQYLSLHSKVRQASFKPSLRNTSASKDFRFSSLQKPKIGFNVSLQQTEKRQSICSNEFSFSSLVSKTPQNRPSFFKANLANNEGVNNRSNVCFSKSKETLSQRLSFKSATKDAIGYQTQKKSYFLNKENAANSNRESLQEAYRRQEYERVLGQRKKDTTNFSLQRNNDQGTHFPNTSSFSKIQIPSAVKKNIKRPVSSKQGLYPSKEDLQSLQELQKKLIQIISV